MEKNDDPDLEKYLSDAMLADEKSQFEQRADQNPELRELLRLQKLALEAVRIGGREDLKKRLAEHRQAVGKQPKSVGKYVWKLLGGGAALLALLFFLFKKKETQSTQIQSQPTENQTPVIPNQQNPPTKTEPPPPIANEPPTPPPPAVQANAERLFAAHFKTFQSDEISGMLRDGSDEPTDFQKFLEAYLKNRHREALQFFEKLSAEDQANSSIQFLKANSLLATGKAAEALPILEKICVEKDTHFLTEAQWLLALAYLKTGDLKNARMTFNFIKTAAGGQLPHAREAAVILKKL